MFLKFCRSCGDLFESGESFCQNDGTRLEEASESIGQLVGDTLSETVKLERIEFADAMGERYGGRLTQTKRPVYVTVFNRGFRPANDALRLVETARAKVGSPMPTALTTILRAELDKDPPFIVETAPRGPSIRSLMHERGRLDWQTAAKIGANVARIIEWLNEAGVTHHGLHPGSIFITDIGAGNVQLGEWYSEDAQWVENPMQALKARPEAFVGYVEYMAPELAESSDAADLRSAVYALGVLIYEMVIGKPPFVGPSGGEILRRHVHEQPVRLSIARSGGEVHPDLDQLVEMMLAKNPDKRFQSPAAIVAALSNLVERDPDELAPPVERAESQEDDDLYSTIEMSQIDRSEVPGLDEYEKKKAQKDLRSTAQNPVAKATRRDESATSEPASRADADDAEDTKTKKTMMLGNIGKALEKEAERQAKESQKSDAGSTLMMGSVRNLGTAPDVDDDASAEGVGDSDSKAEILKPAKIGSGASTAKDGEPAPDETDDGSSDLEDELDDSDSRQTVQLSPELMDEVQAANSSSETSSEEKPEVADPEPSEAEESQLDDNGEEAESDEEPSEEDGGLQIGFVEMDRSVELKDDDDDWFSRTTEDAWEDSMIAEHHEQAENRNRQVVFGLIGALAIAFVGLFVYFQFIWEPEPEEGAEEVAAAEETSSEEEDPADLDALQAKIVAAMDDGRMIQPVGNSAVSHLQALKRAEGEDGEKYVRLRDAFVKRALEQARSAEKDGSLLLARNLAGYASQLDPQNAELKAYAGALHRRYTGVDEVDAGAGDAGALAKADTGSEGDLNEAVAAIETPPEKPEKPEKPEETTKPQRPPEEKAKPDRSKARDLAKRARAAYSRGDVSTAQTLYEAAMREDANNHTIHAGLGQVYFDKAAYSKAVRYQGNAVRLKPSRIDYRISLGQSYYRLGRYQDAIKAWEAVLAKDPNNKNARQYIQLARRKLN